MSRVQIWVRIPAILTGVLVAFLVPRVKCWDSVLNLATTTSFEVLYDSLLIKCRLAAVLSYRLIM